MKGTGITYDGMYQAYYKGQWLGATATRSLAWKAIGQSIFKDLENAK